MERSEIDGLTYEMTLLEKVKHFKNEALKAIVNSDEDYVIDLLQKVCHVSVKTQEIIGIIETIN